MPTIKTDTFSGIMPRVHPTLLPDGCAVKANNCVLKSGKLSPILMPSKTTSRIRMENGLSAISLAQSLYLWRRGATEEFLAWPGIVRVTQSNIADDLRFRIFVTGETGVGGTGINHPCAYIAAATGSAFTRHDLYKVVLPAPVASVETPPDAQNVRYTAFFQSWVDAYGYESGSSSASDEITYNEGQTVTIGLTTAPTGAVKRRLYKVVTGSETERIQFIFEQSVVNQWFPQTTFTVKDEDAGEVLVPQVSIPEDLVWMTYVPGNFYCGYQTSNVRQVMFCDINRPTNWPVDYMYAVKDDLVGLAVCGNSVYALTTGAPWVITGTAPESMSASSLSNPQGCVSARSICTMDGMAFYASQDGICALSSSSTSATVVSESFFSKREWKALNPSTCIMVSYDSALYAWFTLDDGTRQGYVIDFKDGASAVRTHDEQAKAVCTDTVSDGMYFVREV